MKLLTKKFKQRIKNAFTRRKGTPLLDSHIRSSDSLPKTPSAKSIETPTKPPKKPPKPPKKPPKPPKTPKTPNTPKKTQKTIKNQYKTIKRESSKNKSSQKLNTRQSVYNIKPDNLPNRSVHANKSFRNFVTPEKTPEKFSNFVTPEKTSEKFSNFVTPEKFRDVTTNYVVPKIDLTDPKEEAKYTAESGKRQYPISFENGLIDPNIERLCTKIQGRNEK